MSPGINDHLRNTGALPKSNRCTNRNRERDRSAVNHNSNWYDRSHRVPVQHSNNLFQLDWHPVSERQVTTTSEAVTNNTPRTTKNSNTRSTSTGISQDSFDFGFYNIYGRIDPQVDPRQEIIPSFNSFKMTPPIDPRTQSPLNNPAKPTNTDKMPERGQVEGRLNQIREYIKITSTMMESLSQSSDSRAKTQHEKLSKMVEDLYDSEQKLSKLMEECQKYWRTNENGEMENGESRREQDLRKKVEESQRKLAQLQEHQAHLVGMQLSVRERLNEARQTQRALLAEEPNENDHQTPEEEEANEAAAAEMPTSTNVERLERETEVLRDKLEQLENKKRHMDQLVHELQAVDFANERAGCSSGGMTEKRDKVAELQAMKAQLSHLKALMSQATRCHEGLETSQPNSEPEHDEDTAEDVNNVENTCQIEENAGVSYSNFFNENIDETMKPKRCTDAPTIEQIQAVTRELKEQQVLLQSARAELYRLKQGPSNSVPSQRSSTSPVIHEKKQSNKCRIFEDIVRKDQNSGSSANQNEVQEWGSRNSNSVHSHGSTSGNLWPPANIANGSHEHSVDGTSGTENLLEMGSQTPLENGFAGNFWEMPNVTINQSSQGAVVGSAEYYKQLLLGSQAQQLQMMNTTIQQCCQLLWTQQREMQSLRAAIVQLQNQQRITQSRPSNNLGLHEEQHSNLGRTAGQHFGALDTVTLPPSSSLPNLVSLPNSLPAQPLVVSTPANCQQQQPPPQLNNQVPPGNRANNYWDNFRSYSRQNLLSGSSKAATDCATSTSAHSSSSTNILSGGTASHVNNKCNRQQDFEHLAMPLSSGSSDMQYTPNLQMCGRHQLQHSCARHPAHPQQQQDRESASSLRNNCVPIYDVSPQQVHRHQEQQQPQQQQEIRTVENVVDEAIATFRLESRTRDSEGYTRISKKICEREEIKLILMHCLNALDVQKQNENSLPSKYLSNTSDSSDDESEAGARGTSTIPNNDKTNAETQISFMEIIESSQNCITSQNLLEQADSYACPNEAFKTSIPSSSLNTSSINDSVELDQPKSESTNNNQVVEVINCTSTDVHNSSDMQVKSDMYYVEDKDLYY